MEIMDYQWARIKPTLEQLGFTGKETRSVRRTRNDILVPFRFELKLKDDWNITNMASAQLYATDAYPVTGKGEAVLQVWNLTGSDSKKQCQQVAEALTKAGIAARATTYKKFNVVAFDPGDWLTETGNG